MIRLQFERGEICPKVFCDLCGLVLDAASDGHVLYLEDDLFGHESEPIPMSPQFVHRACDLMRSVDEYHGYHWMPMRDFMAYLLVNLKLPVHRDMNPRNL